MKEFINDLKLLVKLRLSLTVVFSASIAFLIGSKALIGSGLQEHINWFNWGVLIAGGFLVTGSANGFNEIIEKDLDKLMDRTKSRPLPSGRMTNGQALVLSLLMGLIGTLLLVKLNFLTGVLSVFSIFLYAFVYTPTKKVSPIAVFVGAFPGALPPLIGYFAAFTQDDLANMSLLNDSVIVLIPSVLFIIQFIWQFPHFWSIAWVVDDDYKKAGFRLLPTTKRDKLSAWFIVVLTFIHIPITLLPTILGFGGYVYGTVAVILGVLFFWKACQLSVKMDVSSAKKVMFISFFILPLEQLFLLFDFIKL